MSVNFVNGVSLMLGDCLEEMKKIPDGSVDMILADLPYGTTSRNEWDKKIPIAPLWEQYERIIKDNGAIVLFSQMPFGAELIMSNKRMFRYEWIWRKPKGNGFLNANRMPLRAHENVLVFYKSLPTYNPQKTMGKPYKHCEGRQKELLIYSGFTPLGKKSETGERFPVDVIKFRQGRNGHHPTQKPVALLEYLIKTYTDEGETVLDNVMGSGSTGVAAVNTGRKFIGIELDPGFYETAKHRIVEALNARMARELKEKNKENEPAPEAGF